MIYGKDKAFNMARSLLPSVKRVEARKHKKQIKRAARRENNRAMRDLTIDPEVYDDNNYNNDPTHEINYAVKERRIFDKIAPFARWAKNITKNINQDSRLSYVKSLVPKSVIGEHAIDHLRWTEHFYSTSKIQLNENIQLNQKEEYKKQPRLNEEQELIVLQRIIEDKDLHKELNNFMHYKFCNAQRELNTLPLPPGSKPLGAPRKLLGSHDIKDFYNDIRHSGKQPHLLRLNKKVYANPNSLPGIFNALREFLFAVYHNKKLQSLK